jgi:hypothetical protein
MEKALKPSVVVGLGQDFMDFIPAEDADRVCSDFSVFYQVAQSIPQL